MNLALDFNNPRNKISAKPIQTPLKVADIFCGAGGLSYGQKGAFV